MTETDGHADRLFRALLKADRSAALGASAASSAQDLNDLLSRILLAAESVPTTEAGSGAPAGNAAGAMAAIEAAVVEAREITRRLALLGRTDASASAGRFAAAEILRAAVSAAAAEPNAEVTVATAPDVAEVAGERDELVQGFRALIRNAAEAMSPPPRHPQIQVQARNVVLAEGEVDGLPPGTYVEFEVRDNGHGIAPENLQRVWEPLFTTKKHATGVGLSTLLAIVRKHGGQVGSDSVVGEGSVFTVFLPPAPPLPAAGGAARSPAVRFRTGRVLVLEADEEMRGHTAGLLQKLDYRCDVARDGDEAVGWYRRYLDVGRPYDAVLLPVGGRAAAQALRALKELDSDVRVVALSTEPAEAAEAAAKAAGCTGWLTKPFTLRELGEVLQSL